MSKRGISDLLLTMMAAGEVGSIDVREHWPAHAALRSLRDREDGSGLAALDIFGIPLDWLPDPEVGLRVPGVTAGLWAASAAGVLEVKDYGTTAKFELPPHSAARYRSQLLFLEPRVSRAIYEEGAAWATKTALRTGDADSKEGLAQALKRLKGAERQLVEAEMRAVHLQARERNKSERAIADELLHARRQERATFRLSRKGKRRPDGSQQYSYPDTSTYVLVDETTGELLPPLGKATVVIPREVGLKWVQPYVHLSDRWKAWYGLRNTVEGSYSHAKDVMREDLGNAAKRRKRGNTFAFVAAALAIASANIRKIVDWIARLASDVPINSKNRYSFGLDAEIIGTLSLTTKEVEPPQRE